MRRIYPQRVVGHWDRFVEGLNVSTLAFFDTVESLVAERGIKDIVAARVVWPERGPFSTRRYYLQLTFDNVVFIISAIPIGRATYFSWWCAIADRGIAAWFAQFGVLRLFLRPTTFYSVDTIRAFEHVLHSSLSAAVDNLTKAKGLQGVGERDNKPVLLDLEGRLP
jgi:hypothetical protein